MGTCKWSIIAISLYIGENIKYKCSCRCGPAKTAAVSDQNLAGNAETVVALQLMQRQRDELSLSMRQLSKEYHQYQCEVGASKNISSNGTMLLIKNWPGR